MPARPAFYRRLNKTQRREYDRSDTKREVAIERNPSLGEATNAVVAALETEKTASVRRASQTLVDEVIAGVNRKLRRRKISVPTIRVLRRRPRQSGSELHGLYTTEEDAPAEIRVWMLTAAERRIVKPRTFLRVLLHEVCHHLDYELFDLPSSFHTGGFHARESSLLRALERSGAIVPGGRRRASEAPKPAPVKAPAIPPRRRKATRAQLDLF